MATQVKPLLRIRSLSTKTGGITGIIFLVVVVITSPLVFKFQYILSPSTDLTETHYTNLWFLVHAWKQDGQVPLWRPTILSGTPFGANLQSPLYYPFNALLFLLPIVLSINMLIFGHLLLLGTGTYLFLRQGLHLERLAALLGATVFLAQPKLIAQIAAGHITILYALSWAPLIFWLLTVALRNRGLTRYRATLGLSVVLALSFFAGHLQTTYFTSLFLLAFAVFLVFQSARSQGGIQWRSLLAGVVLVLGGGTLLALGIISIQLIPALELTRLVSRNELSYQDASLSSFSPAYLLLGLILPFRPATYAQETTIYTGIVPLCLAILSVRQKNGSVRTLFFGGVALFCLLYSLGRYGPLYPLLFRTLPGIALFRIPSRIWFLFVLSVAVLSASTIENYIRQEQNGQARDYPLAQASWGTAILSSSILLIVGAGFGWVAWGRLALAAGTASNGQTPSTLLLQDATCTILISVALGVFLWLGHLRWLSHRQVARMIFGLVLLELLSFNTGTLALAPATQTFAPDQVVMYLRQQSGPFRTYAAEHSISQAIAVQNHLELVDGEDPLELSSYRSFMEQAGRYHYAGYSTILPPNQIYDPSFETARATFPDPRLLGILNTRYVIITHPLGEHGWRLVARIGRQYIYENLQVLPRAFVVPQAYLVTERQIPAALATLAPDRAALLPFDAGSQDSLSRAGLASIASLPPANPSPVGSLPMDLSPRVDLVQEGPDKLDLRVTLVHPGVLIISQAFYPGWVARSETGRTIPILLANGAVQGIPLPAGAHHLSCYFSPTTSQIGGWITTSSLILLFILIIIFYWPRRHGTVAG